MKPYAYLRDPLFIFCLALYVLNRLIIKHYFPNTFCCSYLNDVICIPFWLPIMLFTMRKLGWRNDDHPPRAYEILIPLLVWSWLFESVAPYTATFRGLAFGDHRDILCYVSGAGLGAIFWQRWYASGKTDERPDPEPTTDPQAKKALVHQPGPAFAKQAAIRAKRSGVRVACYRFRLRPPGRPRGIGHF